jgi:hypothetical protein
VSPLYSSLALEEKHYPSTQLEEVLSTRYLSMCRTIAEKPPQVVKVSGHLTVSF